MKTTQLKRNSTVKEFRKQKLIENRPKISHEPQSVADYKVGKKKNKKKKGLKKRFRDLSQGNQVLYKGSKGFDVIKKYRLKRRQESCQLREKSLGRNQIHGSVRSRNGGSDGFFSSIRSCSSDCNSVIKSKRSQSTKKSKAGFFTRNKLNAKFKAISEARKLRLQNTLNKVMKIHAHHAEGVDFSRKSSHAHYESANQSSTNKRP